MQGINDLLSLWVISAGPRTSFCEAHCETRLVLTSGQEILPVSAGFYHARPVKAGAG